MSARMKLNVAYLNGSLFVAGVIGVCCNSLAAFYVTAGVLILLQTVSGGIRPGS